MPCVLLSNPFKGIIFTINVSTYSSENGGYGVSRMRKMDTFASSLLTDYNSVEKEGGREGCPNGLLGYTYGPQIHDLQLHSSHSVTLLHAVHWSFGAGPQGGENVRDAICAPGLHQLMVPLCAAPPVAHHQLVRCLVPRRA